MIPLAMFAFWACFATSCWLPLYDEYRYGQRETPEAPALSPQERKNG